MRTAIFSLIILAGTTFPALAVETFVVQVRGLKPATSAKTAICTENNKPCFLTLPVSGNGNAINYIDIAADFNHKTARFEFMQSRSYLPVANDGQTVLTVPLETQETVFLLDPETLEKPSLVQKPVLRQGKIVAQLEVIAFRQKAPGNPTQSGPE